MVPQNLITALPIWDKKEKQTFRQSYCGGSIGAIECRYDRIVPWTIMHTPAATPNFVYLVQKDGQQAIKVDGLISINTQTVGGIGYVYFEGGTDINQATSVTKYSNGGDNPTTWDSAGSTTWGNWVCEGGEYYLEFSIGSNRYYTELMRLSDFPEFSDDPTNNTTTRVRIEGTNICPVGNLPAALNANKLFIEGKTADPEYLLEKDVAKDGQEEESPVWVKYKKRYKVTFHVIETVADWVASLPLYGGNVNVTDQYGTQETVSDITVEITWPEEFNGCLAQIEFTYSITYLSQTGCC